MSNPWKKIELSDYENHMSLENVYQLQILNKMMQEQFETYDINTIMILGIAGGNGLEHIDKSKIKKVYGIDVNQEFLIDCMAKIGYQIKQTMDEELPNGKKFIRLDFIR